MAIRGVFIVTLLPPITTFGIKSVKYRCFWGIFGRKLRGYLAKTLFFRFNTRLFLSFFCNFTSEKGKKNTFRCSKRYIQTQQKLRSDAVKNTSRCSICYVPTQQKLRPDVVQDTSWRNFRTILLAIWKNDGKYLKSADSGAKSCFFRHFWHHYRVFCRWNLLLCVI